MQINGKGGQFSVAEGGQFYIAANNVARKRNRVASKETWRLVEEWFAAATESQHAIDPDSDMDI